MIKDKLNYWRRIFKVYLTKTPSYLNFWHEEPAAASDITPEKLGKYYMTFADKTAYKGPKDKDGVILFDYHSNIGIQYNPVAIAQYGLGHINQYLKTGDAQNLKEAKIQADWLIRNLEENEKGIPVWKHNFEWHYKKLLQPGWYSALSQGSGISLLVRIYKETNEEKYLETAKEAFRALNTDVEKGGVKFVDDEGNVWVEEYIIHPPTHILNGFLWTIWGIWDLYLVTGEKASKSLFEACVETLKKNLHRYNANYWSLYDLSKQKMKMLASPFYHKLHIAQLEATYKLTGEDIFRKYQELFQKYQKNWFKRKKALIYKAIFKVIYF